MQTILDLYQWVFFYTTSPWFGRVAVFLVLALAARNALRTLYEATPPLWIRHPACLHGVAVIVHLLLIWSFWILGLALLVTWPFAQIRLFQWLF